MPIVVDPAAAQARGTREILRDMNKANEVEIDTIARNIRALMSEVEVDAPQGWRQVLDDQVAALKAAVVERKDIKVASRGLP